MQVVAGLDRFLQQATERSVTRRSRHWHRDFTSPSHYETSIEPNRSRLQKMIGLVDEREPVELRGVADVGRAGEPQTCVGEAENYRVVAVRWAVLKGVEGEGLLLLPKGRTRADVVALPDCDWTPEMLVGLTAGVPEPAQYARRLAENGYRVLVPFLLDRDNLHAGVPGLCMTNQTHREFVYRAAFALGRHIIGYEVQKILAAIDWFAASRRTPRPVGVIGYGEGGLLAF